MNEHTAGEEAYKNGYEAGYQARMKDESQHCLFTDAVNCDPETGNCEVFGWNPKVSKARLDKLLSAPKEEKSQQNS